MLKISSSFSQAPLFSLKALVREVQEECAKTRGSAVRYLRLDGDESKGSVPGIWRPSQIRGCLRKQIYKAVHAPTATPIFDGRQQDTFDRGNVFGAWAAAYFEAAAHIPSLGVSNVRSVCSPGGEALAFDKRLDVGGFVDVLFERHGHQYIVEIKSKDCAKAFSKIKSPDPTHLAQLNDYMAMTGVHAGWVLYLGPQSQGDGRTNIEFKEFQHRYTPSMWQQTENRVNMLRWFMEEPEKMPPESSNAFFECNNCPYINICKQGVTPIQAMEMRDEAKH